MADTNPQHLPEPSSSNSFPRNEARRTSSSSSRGRFPLDPSESLPGQISHDHTEVGSGDSNDDKPVTVLLFGKAGDGKSTVGNMLLGGQVKGYFGAKDCPSRRISENNQWEVIDTVGLFSSGNRSSDAQLIDKLYDYLVTENLKINVICYVKKASKYNGVDEICLNYFKRLFKGQHVEQNVVLVFTSCPDQTTFLKFNDRLISKHMGVEYNKRVGVEFPPTNGNFEIEEMMKEKRGSSLKDLENQLKRVVSESVSPVILESSDHFSCYNTLNLYDKGEGRIDYVRRSIIEIDSPDLRSF